MIYLDTSALAKRYLREIGSDPLRARLNQAAANNERVFTSALTYAEMLTLFGRKLQYGELRPGEFQKATDDFLRDWGSALDLLELDSSTLGALASLTVQYPLKSADAVHLSTAIWLRDTGQLVPEFASGDSRLEFWVADLSLGRIAEQCGLAVHNPEQEGP